jgi:hypothetical protein
MQPHMIFIRARRPGWPYTICRVCDDQIPPINNNIQLLSRHLLPLLLLLLLLLVVELAGLGGCGTTGLLLTCWQCRGAGSRTLPSQAHREVAPVVSHFVESACDAGGRWRLQGPAS